MARHRGMFIAIIKKTFEKYRYTDFSHTPCSPTGDSPSASSEELDRVPLF